MSKFVEVYDKLIEKLTEVREDALTAKENLENSGLANADNGSESIDRADEIALRAETLIDGFEEYDDLREFFDELENIVVSM